MGDVREMSRSEEYLNGTQARNYEHTRNQVSNVNAYVGGVLLGGALMLARVPEGASYAILAAYGFYNVVADAGGAPIIAGDTRVTTFYSQADRVHMSVELFGPDGKLKSTNNYNSCGPND